MNTENDGWNGILAFMITTFTGIIKVSTFFLYVELLLLFSCYFVACIWLEYKGLNLFLDTDYAHLYKICLY